MKSKVVKIGKRYGNLIVIKKTKYFNQNGRPEVGWKCKDDKGKIKYQRNYQLLSRNIKKVPVRAGKKYGEFTTIKIVKFIPKKGKRIYKWECKNNSGDIVYRSTGFLATYKHRRKIHPIEIGKRYGEFTVLEKGKYVRKSGNKVYGWKCKDDNGNIKYFSSYFLIKRLNRISKRKSYTIKKGQQYGEFITIKKENYITKGGKIEHQWKCKNGEGVIKYFRPAKLVGNITKEERLKQEDIYRKEIDKLVSENKHQMGVRNRLYDDYRGGAKKRKIPFYLSFKQFNSIIIQDCHYCGAEPPDTNRWKNCEHKNQPKLKHNGVDRMDSNKGYM